MAILREGYPTDRAEAYHAGEWSNNESVSSESRADSRTVHEGGGPPIVRAGRPRPQSGYSSEELMDMGYIGLYLIRDSVASIRRGSRSIPTPNHLMEPGNEHLYNLNGAIGLPEGTVASESSYDRRFIMYWQSQMPVNIHNKTRVYVDYLHGKRNYTLPHFQKMITDFQVLFPEAKAEEITCGKVRDGNFDSYSIIRWDTYLPASLCDSNTIQYDSSFVHRQRRPDLYTI